MRYFARGRSLLIAVAIVAAACGGSNNTAPIDVPTSPAGVVAESTSSTGSPQPTTTVVPEPVSISLAMSGDTLIHSQVWRAAQANTTRRSGFDFTPMFAEITPLVQSADLAICHMETPLVVRGAEPTTNPLYSAPVEVAWALKLAGFDRCSTASNHTFDKGVAGIEATVAEFESLGMGQSGMARTPAEGEPHLFEVKGVRFSHLAYTYGFNGIEAPNGETWRSALLDPERVVADARKARELGATVVIVSIHWGDENRTTPNDQQVTAANAITKSGLVDLIIGHAAHVVQPIVQVNEKWVLFGLSNLISFLPTTPAFSAKTQDGIIATTNVNVFPDSTVTVDTPVVHPIWVDKRNGVVVRDVLTDIGRSDLPPGVPEALAKSLERTRSVVGDYFPS